MSDATKLEGTEANAETKVEVKTYKYKLNTEKTSGFGLKNHGPMFTLVNPVHELTLDQVKENFLLVQKEFMVFMGAKKDNPLTEDVIKEIKTGVTSALEVNTLKAQVAVQVKEIEDKFAETIKGKDKELAEMKKEVERLTKENKALQIEKEKLEKAAKS